MLCFHVSDLHGVTNRYGKLFKAIADERPKAVFITGDILPTGIFHLFQEGPAPSNFIFDFLFEELSLLKIKMREDYPQIFLILGNDDPRTFEEDIIKGEELGYWQYMHKRRARLGEYVVYGYAHVPPTPFGMKDWERYDVSRYVDPGCIIPEEGRFTTAVDIRKLRNITIRGDIEALVKDDDLSNAIFLFHAPPYKTKLDLASLEGQMVDHVPLDPHVGSIAIQRFIDNSQPLLTLHGHIHESATLTGSWKEQRNRTWMFNAAYEGRELSLVRFDPEDLSKASREII